MFGFLKTLFGAPPPKPAARKTPAAPAMTPERAELIRNAQRVHKAKRKILDALSDEDRARMVAMAITSFLAEAPNPDDRPKKKK